ncbi:hypothetical protein KC324_g20081, partial [Hortaea werneckii]
FKGKKVVIVSVPGAFTPGCQAFHVPPYIENLNKIADKGVDMVVVIASNDAFVMSAWGKVNGVKPDSKLKFMSDSESFFSKNHGWDAGMGDRNGRWAMIIEKDGTVSYAENESNPRQVTVSGAEAVLSKLLSVWYGLFHPVYTEILGPPDRTFPFQAVKQSRVANNYPHGFIELLNDEEDVEAVQFCFDFGQACGSKLGNWAKEKNQDAPYAFFGSVGPLSDGKLFATVFSDVDQYEAIIAKPEFLDGSGVRMLAHCRGNNTYVTADFRTLMECFRKNIKLNFSFYSAGTDPTYTGPADLLKAAIASQDTYLNEVWRPHNLTRGARAPTDIDTGIHQRSEVRLIQDEDSSDLLATSGEAQFRMVCERTFDKALVQVAL